MKSRKSKRLECKAMVKDMLEQCPETRDNNNLMILKIWAKQEPYLRHGYFTFVDFSKLFLDGKFHPTNTILRYSRKWQEEVARLRGKEWNERHGIPVDEVQTEMRNW